MNDMSHQFRLDRGDDEPIALAKHAIAVLEQRLQQDFGVTVAMGAEQEYVVHAPGMPAKDLVRHFGIPNVTAGEYGFRSSASRKIEQRDLFFPASQRVNRTYSEVQGTPSDWCQLETVLTHKPTRADGSALPAHGVALARSIEALRHQLQYMPPGIKPRADGDRSPSPYLRHLQNQITELRYDARVEGINNGLHINFSLNDAKGDPVFHEKNSPINLTACRYGIGQLGDENLYLLGCDAASMERWRTQYGRGQICNSYTDQIALKGGHDAGDAMYLENRLPSGASNPYYAVLLTLAGIYDGLDHVKTGRMHLMESTCEQDYDRLSTETLRQQFQEGQRLRDILNKAEPTLGDRFYQAIDRLPPGFEQTAQQKRHARQAESVTR